MNFRFAVFALALCLPLTARADDAAQHARAQELVTILHSDRMLSQLSGTILKQVSDAAQQVAGPNPSAENETKLTAFKKKATDMVDSQLGWNVMGPEIVNIYAKSFSEDELTAILTFYKSPAGTAFLTKAPEVNQQLQQLAQPKLSALQTQLREAFDEFRKSVTPAAPPTLNNLPPAGPASSPSPTTGPTKFKTPTAPPAK